MLLTQWIVIVCFLSVSSRDVKAEVDECPPPEVLHPCRCERKYGTIFQVGCLGLGSVGEIPALLNRDLPVNSQVQLVIAHSEIKHVPGGLFLNRKFNIHRLLLEDDDISSIDGEAFSGLEEELLYLSLANNRLDHVPAQQIHTLKNLKIFVLNENNINDISSEDFQNLTNLRTLALDSNRIDHIDSDVLPRKLHFLVLGGNKFRYLGDSIRHLGEVQMLSLSNNELTSVSGDLPQSMTLYYLSLDNNKLSNIYGICSGLPSLDTLLLYKNKIRSLRGALKGCTVLKNVNLAYNKLMKLLGDEFSNNQNLTSVDLSHNKLDTLNGAFINLSHLEVLDLSYNRLTTIGRHDFRGLDSLRTLNLSNNRIDSLHGAFQNLIPVLSFLRLAGNRISYVDDDFAMLPSLCKVDLMNNDIFSLGPELLSNSTCPSRRIELHISGNPLLCNFQTLLSLRALRSRSVVIDSPPTCNYQ